MATLPPRDGERSLVPRVVTDSRHVQPGDVFWGLSGNRFDGGAFASEAYRLGAHGVVVANRYVQPAPGCWSLEVENGLKALERLAGWNRDRFEGTLIGVTGSVGKTTTRDMIDSVLGVRLAGVASPKNYNNHVGVPLSMLALQPQHDYAVLELAASATGEIAALAAQCRPKIGVITRIAEAHLGGFGSTELVAEAKTELLAALPTDGHAVLSGDDAWLRRMAGRSAATITWVGRSLDCDLVATNVEAGGGLLKFNIGSDGFVVPVWGRHHLASALAAIAVGRIMGLSTAEIADGLARFEPAPMRCEITEVGGATIINDTYNASPSAMRAALELLRDFDAPGRRIVVCGDMRELGDASTPLHRQLGDEVVTLCGADLLVACGEHAHDVVAGACEAGMASSRTLAYRQPEESLPQLGAAIEAGDVILIKGSRSLAMERLVAALQIGAGSVPSSSPTQSYN
jgi:UDP-N-acetylmuramoyl-tripeptide--D-alanyl-D-alanine ligase